jgi:hypothetical protein
MGNFGNGSFGFASNFPPATPATVVSMQNGLSLVGTSGELGGNQLLHNTSIDQNSFQLNFSNSFFTTSNTNSLFSTSLDTILGNANFVNFSGSLGGKFESSFGGFYLPNSNSLNMANSLSNRVLNFDFTTRRSIIGDVDLANNQTRIYIDDINTNIVFYTNRFLVAAIAGINFIRIDSFTNATFGPTNSIYLDCNFGTNYMYLNMNDNFQVRNQVTGKRFLFVNAVSNNYYFGDLDTKLNQTTFTINDNLKNSYFSSSGLKVLELDAANDVYTIGKQSVSYFKVSTNYFSFFNPGTDASNILELSNNFFTYLDGNSQKKIFIDIAGGTYQFGNIGVAAANIFLNITSAAITGNFDFQFAGSSIFNIASGGIKTTQPSASGAGLWQLGKKLSAAVVLDAANYIEVKIDGVIYKLALVN